MDNLRYGSICGKEKDLSLVQSSQAGSDTHLASCLVGTRGFLWWGKAGRL
jgi:hypothetical protein